MQQRRVHSSRHDIFFRTSSAPPQLLHTRGLGGGIMSGGYVGGVRLGAGKFWVVGLNIGKSQATPDP